MSDEGKNDLSEIAYSDEYEDYICSACGEMLICHTGFRFCPFCGRPFKNGQVDGE